MGTALGLRMFEYERIPEMFYALGLVLGDGHVYEDRPRVDLINTCEAVVRRYYDIVTKYVTDGRAYMYQYPPKGGKKPGKRAYYLVITMSPTYYVWVARYRENLGSLRNTLQSLGVDFIREFVRGFFDAEGCVRFYEYRRVRRGHTYVERRVKLKFTNTNRELLEVVHECLKLLGFTRFHIEGPYVDAYRVTPKYELCTFSVEEARRFLEVVKPLKVS